MKISIFGQIIIAYSILKKVKRHAKRTKTTIRND